MFISSNLPETDYSAYNAATTYGVGDYCILTSTHRIYKSLKASNTGNNPPDNLTGTDPWWQLAGATNKWRVFDNVVGNQAEHATALEYELEPGSINSIALLNVEGTSATITMTDPTDGEVYNETVSLISKKNVFDWYDYFFEPILRIDNIVEFGLPVYPDATVDVSISNGTQTVKCGEIVVGFQRTIGRTLTYPQVGIVEYSRKTTDDIGIYDIEERSYAKRIDCDIRMKNYEMDDVIRILSQYRASPLAWVAMNDYSSMIAYGFYKRFHVELRYLTEADCSLQIEGLD